MGRQVALLAWVLSGGCALDDELLVGPAFDPAGRDASIGGDAGAGIDAGGRDAGGPGVDAAPDGASDAGVPGADASVQPLELPTFGPPERVSGLEASGDERAPTVTRDGLRLVFERPQFEGSVIRDLYLASRADAERGWGDERSLDELNTGDDDANPCWFEDVEGLWLYWAAGSSTRDFFVAAWQPGTLDFAPGVRVDTLSTQGDESDPSLTIDGRLFLFQRPTAGDGREVFEARGQTLDDWVDPPDPVPELSSPGADYDPAISADGRVLVWTTDRPPSQGLDLWIALRQDVDLPFEEPVQLPSGDGEINTDADDLDAFLTADGDLYFSSNRDGDYDLYVCEGFWPG